MNGLKTTVLLTLMSGVFLLSGWLMGGRRGLILSYIVTISVNLFVYYLSDKIALGMYSAKTLSMSSFRDEFLRVHPMMRNLCDRMLLPSPMLWLIPDSSPNSFSTGRDAKNSSLCLTAGLLELLDDEELEAVIAHELSHILEKDILLTSVAATLASMITFLPQNALFFGAKSGDDERSRLKSYLLLFFGPIAAALIRLTISKQREFSADLVAAKYTGKPQALIHALEKLENWSKRFPMDATLATAHLFIVKPFTIGRISRMFNTHPETSERIARLQLIAPVKIAVTQ